MMKIQKVPQQKGTLAAFMNLVERVCNRLPPPAILFCLLFVLTALLGALFTEMGVHLETPPPTISSRPRTFSVRPVSSGSSQIW